MSTVRFWPRVLLKDSIIFKHEIAGRRHASIDIMNTSTVSIFEYCRIQDGWWDNIQTRGSAIFVENSSPLIKHCTFYDNYAYWGGAVYLLRNTTATIESNLFINNKAKDLGGAIGCNAFDNLHTNRPRIINNLFISNIDTAATGQFGGGALSIYTNVQADLINNVFYDNHTINGYGGAILIWEKFNKVNVYNCIFLGNSAGTAADNIAVALAADTLTIDYSDIEGGNSEVLGFGIINYGSHNITANPAFVNIAANDFHLDRLSPCIDAGTSTAAPLTDYDGNATNQDGDNSGSGQYDIGAFEFLQQTQTFTGGSVSNDYYVNTFEAGSSNHISSITLNNYSSGTGDIEVICYTKSRTYSAPEGSRSVWRWYNIVESGNLSYTSANLRLYYSNDENRDNLINNSLCLWHFNGYSWILVGGTITRDTNYVQIDNVDRGILSGYWAFADPADHPLPVQLLTFSAAQLDQAILLSWETAAEFNNLGFEIWKREINNACYQCLSSCETNPDLQGLYNSNSGKKYEYLDKGMGAAGEYMYLLVNKSLDGQVTELDSVRVLTGNNRFHPEGFMLSGNYPNPFNQSTRFDLNLNEPSEVSFKIFNILAENIYQREYNLVQGAFNISWEAAGQSTGIYFYALKIKGPRAEKIFKGKMILVR